MIKIGVSGLIAYEAALRFMKENRKELEERFSGRFLKSFDNLALHGSVFSEDVMEVREEEAATEAGGLFGTVWRALDALEKCDDLPFDLKSPIGCRIDLRQIPLRQEITEICELFDENPYEADSAGAYLVIWEEDAVPCRENRKEIWFHMADPAADIYTAPYPDSDIVSIGYITYSKDRLIINGDMVRYLTPRGRQMTDITRRKKDRRSTDGKKR